MATLSIPGLRLGHRLVRTRRNSWAVWIYRGLSLTSFRNALQKPLQQKQVGG